LDHVFYWNKYGKHLMTSTCLCTRW